MSRRVVTRLSCPPAPALRSYCYWLCKTSCASRCHEPVLSAPNGRTRHVQGQRYRHGCLRMLSLRDMCSQLKSVCSCQGRWYDSVWRLHHFNVDGPSTISYPGSNYRCQAARGSRSRSISDTPEASGRNLFRPSSLLPFPQDFIHSSQLSCLFAASPLLIRVPFSCTICYDRRWM